MSDSLHHQFPCMLERLLMMPVHYAPVHVHVFMLLAKMFLAAAPPSPNLTVCPVHCRRGNMGAGLTHLIMPYIFTGMASHQPDFIAWRCAYFVPGFAQVRICFATQHIVGLRAACAAPASSPVLPRCDVAPSCFCGDTLLLSPPAARCLRCCPPVNQVRAHTHAARLVFLHLLADHHRPAGAHVWPGPARW